MTEIVDRFRRGCVACNQTGSWHCSDPANCSGMCFEWKDLIGKWHRIDYQEYEERLNFYKQGENLRIAPALPTADKENGK
jgi:hypothetical protein